MISYHLEIVVAWNYFISRYKRHRPQVLENYWRGIGPYVLSFASYVKVTNLSSDLFVGTNVGWLQSFTWTAIDLHWPTIQLCIASKAERNFWRNKKMERILRGIMRYRHTTREQMVKEFVQVKNDPHVSEEEKFLFFFLPMVRSVYFEWIHVNDVVSLLFLVYYCSAESRVFHMYGQSYDSHEVHRDARRWHVCR